MQIPKDYIGRLGPEQKGRAVFAVDFDGTLCESSYPQIGEAKLDMIKYVKSLKAQGHKVILWTCRERELLDDAIVWCGHRGITFHSVNENLPELIERFGGDCRKISADYYVEVDSICGAGGMWISDDDPVYVYLAEVDSICAPPKGVMEETIESQTLKMHQLLEELGAAFLQKTGFNPDEVELVQRGDPVGGWQYHYRKIQEVKEPGPQPWWEEFHLLPPQESVLAEAERMVEGEKMEMYGAPEESFEQIAQCWSALLSHKVSTKDVALMMVMLKIIREKNKPKRDNLVDIAGYARCAERIEAGE